MLIAETTEKERVDLTQVPRSAKENFQSQKYLCPACGGKLILKWGQIKQPHFAHEKNADCACFSEGETKEHLLGKSLLVQWCQASDVDYQLEAYLPALKQRPDLLVGEHLAIEFQCSPLSKDRLEERTNGYLKAGYEVWWILGKKYFQGGKIAPAMQAFLYFNQTGFHFWQLDTAKEILSLYSDLHYQAGPGLVHQRQNYTLSKVTLPLLLEELKSAAAQTKLLRKTNLLAELKAQRQMIQNQLFYRQPLFMQIQAMLYAAGQDLHYLPFPCFLPLFYSLPFGKSEILWKCLFWFELSKFPEKIWQEQEFYQHFKACLAFYRFPLPKYPLIADYECCRWFLEDYLTVLTTFGFVERHEQHFSLTKEVNWENPARNYEKRLESQLRAYNLLLSPEKYGKIEK